MGVFKQCELLGYVTYGLSVPTIAVVYWAARLVFQKGYLLRLFLVLVSRLFARQSPLKQAVCQVLSS